MKIRNHRRQRGQALTELTLVIPVFTVILAVPSGFAVLTKERMRSDAATLDAHQLDFARKEDEASAPGMHVKCANSSFRPTIAQKTRWPDGVDQQRALSMAALRVSCLAEGSARLGVKAATSLWAVHVATPHEGSARALSLTICPRIQLASERLRATTQATHRTVQLRDRMELLHLKDAVRRSCGP